MIIFCIIFSKDKLIFKINFKEKINKKYLAYYFFYYIFKIKFNNLNIFVTYILIIHNLNYLIFL